MKASIGRIVIVKGEQVRSNGTDLAPAIVTRVWSERSTSEGPVGVNVTAHPDQAHAQHLASVTLYDNEELAVAAYKSQVDNIASHKGDPAYAGAKPSPVAYWPPRV